MSTKKFEEENNTDEEVQERWYGSEFAETEQIRAEGR